MPEVKVRAGFCNAFLSPYVPDMESRAWKGSVKLKEKHLDHLRSLSELDSKKPGRFRDDILNNRFPSLLAAEWGLGAETLHLILFLAGGLHRLNSERGRDGMIEALDAIPAGAPLETLIAEVGADRIVEERIARSKTMTGDKDAIFRAFEANTGIPGPQAIYVLTAART